MYAQEIVTFDLGNTKGEGAPAHVTDTKGPRSFLGNALECKA